MIGAGTSHAVSVDGGTVWIPTPKMKNPQIGAETRSMNEDNYIDSVNKYKEFVAGTIDGGDFSYDLKWDRADAGQVAMNAAFDGDGEIMGRITFPDNSTFTYDGRTQERSVALSAEETITMNYKLKISGKPIYAD